MEIFIEVKPGDLDNNLLRKILTILWFTNGMMDETEPKPADNNNNLLRKIAEALGASGKNVPRPGDTDNKLLQKILATLVGI